MTVLDRVWIERAVVSHDFWLDLRGTPWRRRRDLRAELRGNLRDATPRSGSRPAMAALGNTREMAAAAHPEDSDPASLDDRHRQRLRRPPAHPARRTAREPRLGRRRHERRTG